MTGNPYYWLGRVAQISEMEKSGRLNRAHAVKELHAVVMEVENLPSHPQKFSPVSEGEYEDALTRLNRQLEQEAGVK